MDIVCRSSARTSGRTKGHCWPSPGPNGRSRAVCYVNAFNRVATRLPVARFETNFLINWNASLNKAAAEIAFSFPVVTRRATSLESNKPWSVEKLEKITPHSSSRVLGFCFGRPASAGLFARLYARFRRYVKQGKNTEFRSYFLAK